MRRVRALPLALLTLLCAGLAAPSAASAQDVPAAILADFRQDGRIAACAHPEPQVRRALAELPADVDVVAYCRGAYCVLAHDAVRLLHARGRRAARLTDGMLEWRLADLPVAA